MKTQTQTPETTTPPVQKQLDTDQLLTMCLAGASNHYRHDVESTCRLGDGKHIWGSGQRHTYEFKPCPPVTFADDTVVDLIVRNAAGNEMMCPGTVIGGIGEKVYVSVASDAVLERTDIKLRIPDDENMAERMAELASPTSSLKLPLLTKAFQRDKPCEIKYDYVDFQGRGKIGALACRQVHRSKLRSITELLPTLDGWDFEKLKAEKRLEVGSGPFGQNLDR